MESLTQKLGVDIDPELLALALTHRSYAYEHGGIAHNERLEFLGDSVLGFAVTDLLYREHPDDPEGELAKRRAGVVSTVALAQIARDLELGQYLRLGKGEDLTGGREKDSILADATEAVIGAAYLSAGIEVTARLVARLVEPLRDDPDRSGPAIDPKTALQELATRQGRPAPTYGVEATGPDHRKRFSATVAVGDERATGDGTSKKQAEMAAALAAWRRLSEMDA